MAVNLNYLLKVVDAKPAEVQKALEQAGIKVRSILEMHKEETAVSDRQGLPQ
jgi:hypothetical protein